MARPEALVQTVLTSLGPAMQSAREISGRRAAGTNQTGTNQVAVPAAGHFAQGLAS